MRISRSAVLVGALVLLCAHVVASCLPPGDCQRNTDCDQGLTCVAGKCAGGAGASDAAPQDAADSSNSTDTGGDAAGGFLVPDAGDQS